MNNESAPEEKGAPGRPPQPLLKTLENILHNRIIQKKVELHKTHNRGNTERVWTEIHWNIAMGIIGVVVSEGGSRSDIITNN